MQTMDSNFKETRAILFYVPNLIGYARLVLIFIGHFVKDEAPATAVLLYAIFAFLDSLDGWAARKLNQCSSFGAWLDVIVDNIGRTLIWSNFKWGAIISNLEWITYVCNHSHGSEWKEKAKQDSVIQTPLYVTKVMAKGFKTPYGILAIGGLHCLPIWMFGWEHNVFQTHLPFLSLWVPPIGFIILLIGRALCAMVEIWCVTTHLKCLMNIQDKHTSKLR